ncbi:T9SS type A sorting domain-containing protein [bacterium]|nr:T9SS type A sorting domain-containing protein [bacterium]
MDRLLLIEFEALPNTEGKTSELILEDVQLSDSLSIKKINGLATVLPSQFHLYQNYPNPFNPETWIPYQLSEATDVRIEIYTLSGNSVVHLDLGHQAAGVYTDRTKAAYWDGRNHNDERVSSGVYFYVMRAGDYSAVRRLVVLK